MSVVATATAPPVVLALVVAVLLAPHVVLLRRVRPPVAIAVWLLALAVRALAAVALAGAALAGLAGVPVVRAFLDWCWHAVLPAVPAALGFGEHPVTHAAVAVPAAVLIVSIAWVAGRLARAALAKRRLLGRELGPGPHGSTVIEHDGVLLAVTAIGRGRVLVSDRALRELDDAELAAGLMHERAHLRRRHRPLLATAALLGAVARPLPGTRAALHELRFHLERDADHYTVRALRDPLALASAICKAAAPAPGGAVTGLGGRGRVSMRLEELLEGGQRGSSAAERGAWALSVALAVVFVALAGSILVWGMAPHAADGAARSCEHVG